MPPTDAVALHAGIPNSSQDGETFYVPCDTSATISFSFSDRAFEIATADWRGGKGEDGRCRSNIIGRQTFGENQWLVGDVFLKNVYAVFDAEGEGRVGFGVLDEGEEQQNAQGTSTSSSNPTATGESGTSTTATGTSASTTAGAGSSDPSAAAESVPQGQGQQGSAASLSSSASLASWLVAFTLVAIALCI